MNFKSDGCSRDIKETNLYFFLAGGQPGGQPQRSSISACPSPNRAGSPAPSLAGSTSSLPTAVLSSSQRESTANQHHGPFPTGRKGLVERSSLIRHTTSHLHPKKPKTDFKMIQKLSGSQAATNSTSAENQAFMYEVRERVHKYVTNFDNCAHLK